LGKKNIDKNTVLSFGDEWKRFNQMPISNKESEKTFNEYFSIFPWNSLPDNSEGFDMGCGSGRGARLVAPKVGKLHCIDPSESINIAKLNLSNYSNTVFHRASVGDNILPKNSQDFGYSLGVLHHVPNTNEAIKSCVLLLKKNAPLLIYLYYAFDNKSLFYKLVWYISNIIRKVVCHFPSRIKNIITDVIATIVYFPMAKLSCVLSFFKINVSNIPLSYYMNHSFYTMRTDSRDRFGTPLEKRFTKIQIRQMMEKSGLVNIVFYEHAPYWCACGIKK